MGKRAPRTHLNYTLRKGRKVVKYGITNDPDRRLEELIKEGLDYTSMTLDGVRVSEKTARKREKKRIEAYKRNHWGKPPKYNI